jgi:hypothetical protein
MVYNADMQPKYYGAAAQYNKPTGGGFTFNPKVFIVLGLALVVILALVGGMALVGSLTKGPQDDFIALAAREGTLQQLVDKEKTNIQNGDLKKINAEADTLFLSDARALSQEMQTLFGVTEIPETVLAAQSTATVEETLKAAATSGTFDRAYVSALQDQLSATYDMAKRMKDAVSSTTTKTVLELVMSNQVSISDQLTKLQL